MNSPTLPANAGPILAEVDGAHRGDLGELLAYTVCAWDEERRVLARQLHDQLGSGMTGLSMHLTLLTQQLPQDSPLRGRTGQMQQLLANIVARNRTLQARLWNDKLEFLGIKVALRELISEFSAQHPIVARISLPDDDVQHTPEQGLALLRCAELGLHNIATHAHASEAELVLDEDEDALTLSVRDNGRGSLDLADAALSGHSLRLLRERAHGLGGELSLLSNGARGTCLRLFLPKPALRVAV